jgi:alginate O-acetyltransferase complex protein AlgI
MLFSSPTFLFGFLPIILLVYFLSPWKIRNAILLTGSLIFYAWGEVFYVLVMVASILINHAFGMRISRLDGHYADYGRKRKHALGMGIAANLLILAWFKYANFIFDNINILLGWISIDPVAINDIHLPLGISFFTFQAISYLFDVYRDEAPVQKSRYKLGLYISLFPQLIAGPIVRYNDIANQIGQRAHSVELFSSGIRRFIFGLAKKMLIANPLGEVADNVFSLSSNDLTSPVAWLGIICYALQIYFDFSGYSDMAIGLGRMLGFRFLENFNYPYISQSIQEFWRRWHISLSSWFRDYLYIPLGGNRGTLTRTYINLIIVFLLTGLWHGASWNFIVWGMTHGFFMLLERGGLGKLLGNAWPATRHLYTLFVVTIAWVFFRADTLPQARQYLSGMFGMNETNIYAPDIRIMMTHETTLAMIAGLLLATPLYPALRKRLTALHLGGETMQLVMHTLPGIIIPALLFIASLAKVASSTYNPFIYFRF